MPSVLEAVAIHYAATVEVAATPILEAVAFAICAVRPRSFCRQFISPVAQMGRAYAGSTQGAASRSIAARLAISRSRASYVDIPAGVLVAEVATLV